MIADSLKNYKSYLSICPRLEKAFDFIFSNDLASFADGRHDIDGDNIFAMISSPQLKRPEDAPVETHRRYLDIQLVLSGKEAFGWISADDLTSPEAPFDEAKDICFWKDIPTMQFELHEGQMAIFLPEDGHAPMIGEGQIKKCIVKVLL